MMRVVLALLFPVYLMAQNKCSEYVTGKFRPEFGPYMNKYEIIRTDSTQTDIDKVMNTKSEYKVVWTDRCQYKLKRVSGQGYKTLMALIWSI